MTTKITPPVLGTTYRVDNPGTTLQTLIAPASNTKGITVFFASIYHTGGTARLMSKSSAPSAWNDATARTIALGCNEGTYGAQSHIGHAAFPITIPVGEGLYFQGSVAGAAANNVDVNATIL